MSVSPPASVSQRVRVDHEILGIRDPNERRLSPAAVGAVSGLMALGAVGCFVYGVQSGSLEAWASGITFVVLAVLGAWMTSRWGQPVQLRLDATGATGPSLTRGRERVAWEDGVRIQLVQGGDGDAPHLSFHAASGSVGGGYVEFGRGLSIEDLEQLRTYIEARRSVLAPHVEQPDLDADPDLERLRRLRPTVEP